MKRPVAGGTLALALLFSAGNARAVEPPPDPAEANAICRAVFAAFGYPLDRQRAPLPGENVEPGETIAQRIAMLIARVHGADAKPIPYKKLVGPADGEKTTLHAPIARGRKLPPDVDDARVVLELPPRGSPTVWDALTVKERKDLADALVGLFTDGKYDVQVAGKRVGNELANVLKRRELDGDGLIPEWGIVPRQYLEAAAKGCKVGACRQGAVAFASLLGELGVPNEHLRLVAGRRKVGDQIVAHIWVEIRLEQNAPWRELDPTAGAAGSGFDGLARAVGRSVDNASAYPLDQMVFENILVPEKAPELPNAPGFEAKIWARLEAELQKKPTKD